MIHKLTSGNVARTHVNFDRDKVLLTTHNEYDYCRISMTPKEARRVAERLNELADELENRRMRYADSEKCTYVEVYEPEHVYVFTGPCKVTGKPYSVSVPAQGLFEYRHGKHIQDAFPNMSAGDREFLMSGYSPEGWQQIFGKEEDDENEVPTNDEHEAQSLE